MSYAPDDVVIVAACRTPIGSLNGSLASLSGHELGSVVIREVLQRAGGQLVQDPSSVSEVIFGQVLSAGAGQNPCRQAAIGAGLPPSVPAWSVSMVCGSGLQAVCLAAQSLRCGTSEVVVAGGQESMSRAPFVMPPELRSAGHRMGDMTVRDSMIIDGLTDAFHSIHMGVTAENVAKKFSLSRSEQDEFAAASQQKCERAMKAGWFQDEIVPVETKGRRGEVNQVTTDEHPRAGVTAASLNRLRPVFSSDPGASVTAGNSSGLNDGAAALLLTTWDRLNKGDLVQPNGSCPLARIVSWAHTGCDPTLMGLGPVEAVRKALSLAKWTTEEVDLFELNEAFAAQSIAVCRELDLPSERVNIGGGAIALGHPIGGSGARILVTLVHALRRTDKRRGVAALCVGGGMGVAVCVERLPA